MNVVAERYRFRQRGQWHGETTDQYVAALKELAATCEFGAMEEEMIRNQLVEKTNSNRIRERLLLEVDLTLKKAVTIASQIETAVAEANVMSKLADGTVQVIQQSHHQHNRSGRETGKNAQTLRGATRCTHLHSKGKHVTGVGQNSILPTFKNAMPKTLSVMHVRKKDISPKCAVDTKT